MKALCRTRALPVLALLGNAQDSIRVPRLALGLRTRALAGARNKGNDSKRNGCNSHCVPRESVSG
jgi:hypothetical protein